MDFSKWNLFSRSPWGPSTFTWRWSRSSTFYCRTFQFNCFKSVWFITLLPSTFVASLLSKIVQFWSLMFFFRINAPRGYGIRLTWREFHIDGCARSAIYIFDGKETDGIEPDRYCGKQKPRDWSSTGMFIRMLDLTGS